MQLSLQLSKLQGTTSYFDGNMGRVGVKSDTVSLVRTLQHFQIRIFFAPENMKKLAPNRSKLFFFSIANWPKIGEHITHLHISDIVTFETDITDT